MTTCPECGRRFNYTGWNDEREICGECAGRIDDEAAETEAEEAEAEAEAEA